MVYSACHEDEVLDFKFTKPSPDGFCYNFYISNRNKEMFIGQIFKLRKHKWSAISWMKKGRVDGFGSRMDAAEYLLKLNDIGQPKDY